MSELSDSGATAAGQAQASGVDSVTLGNLVGRVARALMAASLAGLVMAGVDASWSAAAGDSGVAALLLPLGGLLAPMFLGVGLGVGLGSLMLHPEAAPSLGRLRQFFESESPSRAPIRLPAASAPPKTAPCIGEGPFSAVPERRMLRDRSSSSLICRDKHPVCRSRLTAAWAAALLGPAAFVWFWVNARLSESLLLSEIAAPGAGAAMGAGMVGSALMLALSCWGCGTVLQARFPNLQAMRLLLFGLLSFLLLFGLGVALGTTSGTGGRFAIFGVLKRPELDLRASGVLFLVVLVAYLGPAWLARLRASICLAVALLPLLLLPLTHSAWAEPGLSLGVERGSALSKLLLPVYRSFSDADADGFSATFGGGDCNDKDAAINPNADDIPENGVDEDCSGSDAKKVVFKNASEETPKDAQTWLAEKLDKKFNVVLITIDTLRFDLGYMGYERPVSPNIDKLAASSTVFEKAYALASYTAKSLPPMLIGKYPSETHRDWAHFNRFSQEDLFLAERLQKAGLFTVSVQGYWYFFHKGYGFERGFDVLDTSAAPKAIQIEGDRSSNSDKLSDAAIAQLKNEQLANKQFFMWVHYIDPHSEYAPHEGFDFGNDSRARYDGEVAFVDHHVGRVLQALEATSFKDRTAIILTSDHGEAFKEHGMIRHGFEVWEELVRVPFIVHVPGAKPHRVSARRGIIDVVPTVLELQKVPAPTGEGSDFVSGQSLLKDVLMPPGYTPEERIVFVDMSAGPHNAERQAFIEADMKLIASAGRSLGLYDLKNDPGEKENLMKDKERAEPVSERFKAFRRQQRVVNVRPR